MWAGEISYRLDHTIPNPTWLAAHPPLRFSGLLPSGVNEWPHFFRQGVGI